MKVRAKKMGYYDNRRWQEGDIFVLSAKKGKVWKENVLVDKTLSIKEQFSPSWMEEVVAPVAKGKTAKAEAEAEA